jgi:hypothetical protein
MFYNLRLSIDRENVKDYIVNANSKPEAIVIASKYISQPIEVPDLINKFNNFSDNSFNVNLLNDKDLLWFIPVDKFTGRVKLNKYITHFKNDYSVNHYCMAQSFFQAIQTFESNLTEDDEIVSCDLATANILIIFS